MNRIRVVSAVLRYIFILTLILLPVFTILYWLTNGYPFGPHMPLKIFPSPGDVDLPSVKYLPRNIKIIGFLINLIPIVIFMMITYFLIRLFRLYERGQIFTVRNVKYIRWVGIMLLVAQLIKPIYSALLSYVLTLHNPPGYRYVFVSFTVQDMAFLIIAVLIILISWIMDEGHKIQEEQSYTV